MKFKHGIFQQGDVVNLRKNGEISKVKKGKFIIASIKDDKAILVLCKCNPVKVSFEDKIVNIVVDSKNAVIAKIPKIPVNNKIKFLTGTET